MAEFHIRTYHLDDIDGVYAAADESREHVRRWMTWMTPDYSRTHVEIWVNHAIKARKQARLMNI